MNDSRDNGYSDPHSGGAPSATPSADQPRKPRIEVLQRTPAAAPARGSAQVPNNSGSAAGPGGSPAQASWTAPHQPQHAGTAPERKRRSPTMLLMLLAAVVIAGFLLYTYFSSERSAQYPEAGTQISPADAELLGDPEADADPAEPQEAEPAEPSAVQSSDDEVAAEPEPAAVPAPRTARPVAAAPQAQQAQQEDAVAEAEEPAPARAAPADNDAGASRTVRAFYSALSAGDGSSAAQLVVPAKRRSGPLSAGALSRYYSSFRRPLRVQSVTPVDANTVRVAYDYVLADGRVCRGQAAVDVVQRDGRSLVSGIRTRGPC